MESVDALVAQSKMNIARDKQRLESSLPEAGFDSPDTQKKCDDNTMLRIGEYSPNNPELAFTPHEGKQDAGFGMGFGLYEEKRKKFLQKRQFEYQEYLAKQNQTNHPMSKNRRRTKRNIELEKETQLPIDNTKNKLSDPRTIAVQTDLDELLSFSPIENNNDIFKTRAEKELSPRRISPRNERIDMSTSITSSLGSDRMNKNPLSNNSYNKGSNSVSPTSFSKNAYGLSFLDAEAIKYRNLMEQQENTAKRLAYQEELKNQIKERQRLREENLAKQKHAEELDSLRLEKQLHMLQMSQEVERNKQKQIELRIKQNDAKFNTAKTKLDKVIDVENVKIRKKKIPTEHNQRKTESNAAAGFNILSANSQNNNIFVGQDMPVRKQPYSFNYAENSLFLPSASISNLGKYQSKPITIKKYYKEDSIKANARLEDSTFNKENLSKPSYEPKFLRKDISEMIDPSRYLQSKDSLPIPVLRYTPPKAKRSESDIQNSNIENLEDKWRVPIIQKNIIKHDTDAEGKQASILTQLGSIRKQLQLEQLKLDKTAVFNTKAHT